MAILKECTVCKKKGRFAVKLTDTVCAKCNHKVEKKEDTNE